MTAAYAGVFPIAPTPFRDSGELDLDGMRRVLDCMIDQKVDGICVLANYSEQFLLTDDERILPPINFENRQCGLRATKTVMMEGGVIKNDALRHPLEALHPATRKGLLELARAADPLALHWGK